MPEIRIPLKPGDDEPLIDLQSVFTTVFDRARYQLSLNYSASLSPPLSTAQASWMRELLETGTSAD